MKKTIKLNIEHEGHLTVPPRMKGKVKNAQIKNKKKKKQKEI
ncbi:MAG: hypothetical protein MCSN_3510 [Candidatus Microsyncoccus archaeolyticus]|jgi:hypothetical protein|nr:MAG: hypothetical protein MCSN_3510 [Candidatus Parcubacteria bacterium]